MKIKNKTYYNNYLSNKFTRFLNFIINKYYYKIKTYIIKDIKVKDDNTIDIIAKRKYSIKKSKTTTIDLRVLSLYFNNIDLELDDILITGDKINLNKLSNYLKGKKLITIWYNLPKGEIDLYPSGWQIEISNITQLVKIIKIKD